MNTTLPTREHTIYTLAATMMADARSDADRARIDRALDLVPGVQRMADRPNLFLVTSQTVADAAYRVHQGQCNCPDASKRDARCCKHAYAVALFCQLERAEVDADQAAPTCTCTANYLRVPHAATCPALPPPDPDARYELTSTAYLALVPTAALPPIIGQWTRVPYTPEQQAIADELFGEAL